MQPALPHAPAHLWLHDAAGAPCQRIISIRGAARVKMASDSGGSHVPHLPIHPQVSTAPSPAAPRRNPRRSGGDLEPGIRRCNLTCEHCYFDLSGFWQAEPEALRVDGDLRFATDRV